MDKYKIGILAPQQMENHVQYYDAIITLFLENNCLLSFFGDPKTIKELNSIHPSIEYIPKVKNDSYLLFFWKIRKKAKTFNLIIVEQSYGITLSYIFGFSNVKVKKLYSIHNVNSWLAPQFTLNTVAILTNLSHKYIINNANGVVVVSPNLKKFIVKLNLIGNKPTFYLPFSLPRQNLYENFTPPEKNNKISLVVPGTINPIRRDYLILLNALEKIIKQGISNIQFVLLGKPIYEIKETRLIINKIKEINLLLEDSVIVWDDFIQAKEFNYHLSQADFFISNLNIYYPYSQNYEIYGLTKETGIPSLMLEHKKPCLVIGDYLMPTELKKHVITIASEEELKEVLIGISREVITPSTYLKNYDRTLDDTRSKIESEIDQILSFI